MSYRRKVTPWVLRRTYFFLQSILTHPVRPFQNYAHLHYPNRIVPGAMVDFVSKILRASVHMRIPASCKICGGPSITYATVTGFAFRTHYRKCRSCGATSKGISAAGGMPGKHVLTTGQASRILQVFNPIHPTGSLQ